MGAVARAAVKELYASVWGVETYGAFSPGEQNLPLFLDMSQTSMRMSVLDAGCGSGKGALALKAAGFTAISLCDITDAGLLPEVRVFPFTEVCLWQDLRRPLGGFVDWVYCCDVLEHLPTAFTMLAVSRLLEVARCGVFLSITFATDAFGVWVGEPLHQTVQSFTWWKTHLEELGELVEARDLLISGVFLLKPWPSTLRRV